MFRVYLYFLLTGYLTLGKPAGPAESGSSMVPTETFAYSSQLDADGAYMLYWNINKTHVTFETHVKTHGYVGFGLSGNGQMYPGDVVIGWVKDGVSHFKDCHTSAHAMPVEDESQDWTLLHAEETEAGTVLKFTRKFDTCDKNDFRITDETTRVIFSYHPSDPASMTSLPWHGVSRRGTKSLYIMSASANEQVVLPPDTKEFTLVKNNYHVPAVGTTYHCTTFRLPQLPEKNHIVKYHPIITPGNELHVHHMVIYTVPEPVDSRYDNMNFDCTMGKNTPDALRARSVFIVWAVGGGAYYFPDYTGMPIGTAGDPSFFILETHYDNPTMKAGIVDSSGMAFTYTPTLRQHDAGIIYISNSVSKVQIIPPYEKEFHTKALCSEECLEQVIPEEGVDVFAVFQHAHLLGRGISTRHFRNGTELKPFARDTHYDFNFQDVRALKHEEKLRKGDSIQVDCLYNSEQATAITYGGISTEEEMCVSTMLYYPRVPMGGCGSYLKYEEVNATDIGGAIETISSWDWTKPAVRSHFKSIVQHSDYTMFCSLSKNNTHTFSSVTKKMDDPAVKYIPPGSQCSSS